MNYRAIVLMLILLAAISFPVESVAIGYTTMGYFTEGASSNVLWSTLHDAADADSEATGVIKVLLDSSYNAPALPWNKIIRGYVVFDTRSIPSGYYTVTLSLYGSQILNEAIVPDWYLVLSTISAASPQDPAQSEWDLYSNSDTYAVSSNWSDNTWRNITLPADTFLNTEGYTLIGFRHNSDYADTEPEYVSSALDQMSWDNAVLYIEYAEPPTPTPTPTPSPGNISVNLKEKYSNAALVNQALTVTPTTFVGGETKTSLYGETLHFGVVPGELYWFNASRPGYKDYNETYSIPSSPGIYTVYMERTLTPIANKSYAHFSVIDQTNGGLIPNALILLSDGQSKSTNSAGYTYFSVNNSTPYTYTVSHPNGYFLSATGSFNITSDTSFLVALQRSTGPTPTGVLPTWTPVTVPTTGSGYDVVPTLSAQLRERNVHEGMDIWYTNLPFISQFLFLLFIIGGLGLMAGGTRRN